MLDPRISPGDPKPEAATPQRLGDLLVSTQLITRAQLDEAEVESGKTGEFLCKILVQNKLLSQDDINTVFVKICKIPHISLQDYDIGADVLKLVPKDLCEQYGLIPIDKLGRILTIAMIDPLDTAALEVVRQHCPELRIKPILCNWSHFEQAARKYFATNSEEKDRDRNSMAGFGLSALPAKPAAAPKPAAATVAAATPNSPAAGPSATVDTQALVGAIQAGLRGVVDEIAARMPVATVPPAAEHPGGNGMGAEVLGEVMRQSIREAMTDALQSLDRPAAAAIAAAPDWTGFETSFRSMLEELRETLRQPAPAVPRPVAAVVEPAPAAGMERALQELAGALKAQAPAGDAMGEVIRESIGVAMQDALASIVVQLRAANKPEQVQPSLENFAATIRDSVGEVMQDTLATLAVQMRSIAGEHEGAADQTGAVVEALRESHQNVAATMREVLETSRSSQEQQAARLAELAEAAVQSTRQTSQLMEASLVQNERTQNLRQGQRARHASVSPFGAAAAGDDTDPARAAGDDQVRSALEAEVPLESLTFDSFFPGKANAFTVKIGQSVAESPGGEYNPFFLYGNVGLGKTHLISAVGNQIQIAGPGRRVGYVSASHFSRRLKEALAADAQDAFRENYCHWDVLILDDIQFMGGRVEAQEEFFHIFNVLHQQGRQIIIASDKAPDRLGLLEQRLISRFSSGIVAELKPPEWETRMAILKHHIAASATAVPEEICSLIAMRVPNDIRKMVGSLRKVVAFAALLKEPVTVEMATEILSHIGGEAAA